MIQSAIAFDIYETECNDHFMDETKFDWDDLRLFLAVARAGGLATAAGITGKSAPTLGRRMLTLERRLGAELFHRMPRGYTLTEAGTHLLEQAITLEDRIQPILDIDPAQSAPIVKISAGSWVTQLLCENAPKLIGTDAVRLRFIAADEVLDIGRREALIGIRNHRPDGPGLAVRRVTKVQFAVYAVDSTVQTWARTIGSTPSAKWVAEQARSGPSIEVNSPRAGLDLALCGAARVVLPTFIGLQQTTLKQVSDDISDLEHDQWIVTHHEDRFLPQVRKVISRTYAILRQK